MRDIAGLLFVCFWVGHKSRKPIFGVRFPCVRCGS